MSTFAPDHTLHTPSNKSKVRKLKDKDKERDRKEKTQLSPGERLKIVVRRLPSNLPEDIFWDSVSNWVTNDSVSWKAYYPGKPKKRMNKENIPSRAEIAFKTQEQVALFGREYDGQKFVDKAGNENYAVVEYAPYQKVPGEKKKLDSRHATIEKDEDYISFIKSLNTASATEPISIETLIASTRPPSPPKTTPLLEALKAEKIAQRDTNAIIRNHAHYKDILTTPNPSSSSLKKREEKRKTTRAEATTVKKTKKELVVPSSSSSKPVQQICTKSNTGPSHAVGNTASPPVKMTPLSSSRQSRNKHAAKASKEGVQGLLPTTTTAPAVSSSALHGTAAPSKAFSSSTPAAPSKASSAAALSAPEATSNATVPTKRGRPVLGLGLRHFEAALSGVGVTAGKRREKSGDPTTPTASSPAAGLSSEMVPTIKSSPPSSPRRSRHQKEGSTCFSIAAPPVPDANGAGVLAVPMAPQGDGGRGGRRGGGRGRGRGGPGPSRIG